MSELLAIIGGTGLTELSNLKITRHEMVSTPFGEPSAPFVHGRLCHKEVVFLARHGSSHTIPPHKINYRANLWALHEIGVKQVIAIAAVGGISNDATPGKIIIPDQIIDYTYSRANTFYEERLSHVTHIDFTCPYSQTLRTKLISGCKALDNNAIGNGVYAATQGPRLETAAEIRRLEKDGCTIVGMTGMPEAALARELGLEYAACTVVANPAAGKDGKKSISMADIEQVLLKGMEDVRKLLEHVIPTI